MSLIIYLISLDVLQTSRYYLDYEHEPRNSIFAQQRHHDHGGNQVSSIFS